MKCFFSFLLLVSCTAGFSQSLYYVDRVPKRVPGEMYYLDHGKPGNIVKYGKVISGSAYFSESWMKAVVNISDTAVVKNLMVRLDLLGGSLEYKNDKGEPMVSTSPVSAIQMTDSLRQTYTFIPISRVSKSGDKGWYQVLSSGPNMTLLKEYHKGIFDSPAYASSQVGQEIQTTEKYYISLGDNLLRVKKFSDITNADQRKAAALQQYIKKEDLDANLEWHLVALVEYYHTLK